jgi:hypothetical protein
MNYTTSTMNVSFLAQQDTSKTQKHGIVTIVELTVSLVIVVDPPSTNVVLVILEDTYTIPTVSQPALMDIMPIQPTAPVKNVTRPALPVQMPTNV